ncbi:MAG: hypothetical protein ACLTDR_03135 [Adlercreutzia equolifaciens]
MDVPMEINDDEAGGHVDAGESRRRPAKRRSFCAARATPMTSTATATATARPISAWCWAPLPRRFSRRIRPPWPTPSARFPSTSPPISKWAISWRWPPPCRASIRRRTSTPPWSRRSASIRTTRGTSSLMWRRGTP